MGIKFNNYFKILKIIYLNKKDNDIEDDSIFNFTKKELILKQSLKHKNLININEKTIFKII